MNLTLHQATQARDKSPRSKAITFARPALVDQHLNFYFGQDAFEICDENNQLLAFGQYS